MQSIKLLLILIGELIFVNIIRLKMIVTILLPNKIRRINYL